MLNANAPQHIYQRTISDDDQDSLSIIVKLIKPGQTLLDLGMGAGALGQHLSQKFAIVADGVSLNPVEAKIARQWYRCVEVADLEVANLSEIFEGQLYDCIVCADVLEHLRTPQYLLSQCKAMLKPGGRLITSVPNAGYCGLIAELIQGEFRYRPEGLLDQTHLRFFTRLSLQRFFRDHGWSTLTLKTTQRDLLDSEFRVAFDSLPPAVSRHLLALPDALTYQFITVLQASETASADLSASAPTEESEERPSVAYFSAELYLAKNSGYDESIKLSVTGRVGDANQSLVFDIPASPIVYTAIRLDPADRAGFFKLRQLCITIPNDQIVWQWRTDRHELSILADSPHQQILLVPPWTLADNALLLLYGDDPWLELPLTSSILNLISVHGARLSIDAGWPMSADYLQASIEIKNQKREFELSNATMQHELEKRSQELSDHALKYAQCEAALLQTENDLRSARQALTGIRDERFQLINQLRTSRHDQSTTSAQLMQLRQYLQSIEQSTVFRATRPLVNLKMRLERLTTSSALPSPMQFASAKGPQVTINPHPVDIIVPVYRGLEDTRCCLESVLANSCKTAWRLLVINDCSPEPELTQWLRDLAQLEPRVILLENPENLGFVGTVNRGMELSQDHDVLLLNSDAEVANDWLDRIQRAAYSTANVASVTPFSNNATICSYPGFCKANDVPAGQDTASLDALFARHLTGQTVQIPTGIGFCMYIRRQCLQEVGLFDIANFGKGYGEENDFCVRAQTMGWVHLHALDTFVRHAGGISFGFAKSEREAQAMETLRRLHPSYETAVMDFVGRDPARIARSTIDIARLSSSARPVILNVIHNREGGTLRHIQELAQRLGGLATFLRLTPAPKGVVLRLEGPSEAFSLHFAMPQDQFELVETLRLLQVGHIHYHHLLGHEPCIADLAAHLGVSHDFTAHDFFSYCPQISLTDHTDRYCGELGLAQCHQCLQRHPAPGGASIEHWRERNMRLLSQARYVIAPSQDTAQRLQRFAPCANIQVVPHATLDTFVPTHAIPCPAILPTQRPLKVAVLGALSKIKGADVLEEVATLAAQRGLLVDFHLIGYAYRSLRTPPKANLTVHGAYDDKDLPQLLRWLQPDAIWFPAVWPETYSYTLSASLESALPIIAPNIGAFAERLQNRSWTWLGDWKQTPAQWIEFFRFIRDQHFLTGIGPQTVEHAPTHSLPEETTFTYRGAYLAALPRPTARNDHDIQEMQLQLTRHLCELDIKTLSGNILKSSTLRTIARLRTSAVLSPLARMVPTHLQRRIKSWLGK